MLSILLKNLGTVRGIYGPNKNLFPARAAFMHPEAAAAFVQMNRDVGPLPFSDILRGAEESLVACKAGRGSQPPGFSGHNFGLSVDADIATIMREKKWTYPRLVDIFTEYGFYPYRHDHTRGPEEWHFNFLGVYAKEIIAKTAPRAKWQTAANEIILTYYKDLVPLSPMEIQGSLKKLGLYSGTVDGSMGALTHSAIDVFCNAWSLSARSTSDLRFQRTLAFVAADKTVMT